MPVIIVALITTFFAGWVNVIITAIQEDSMTTLLLAIFCSPIASVYGLYLFF